MSNTLGYVSLFSSAGVGCHGFNLEGYDCIVTSELIERRLQIQKHNKVCSLESGYVGGDITSHDVQAKIKQGIKNWLKTYGKKEVDVIVATPPCQGISVANHKKNDELSRNSLVVESIKMIDEIRPKYFVLENVRGFLKTICTDVDGNNKEIIEAIKANLAGGYNIGFRVMNFKDFGSHSSRTRTVVIGVRKDIEEVTPYELFPKPQEAPTVRQLIGDFTRLPVMGQIDSNDIYHSFRPYDVRMMDWVKDLKEGQSAFENDDPLKRPHQIIDGKIVPNTNKNGDKYRRCHWDKVAPCAHTRNDILASQSTIHPEDPRVFSIRELMKFMTIPDSFKWDARDTAELNSLDDSEKKLFLKKNEMNIRQCLGEAVPTAIFGAIARNISQAEAREEVSLIKIKRTIARHDLADTEKLIEFVGQPNLNFATSTKIAELANAQRLDDAAFYTRQDLCFNLVADLPDFKGKKVIRILEPSVGTGNFLPSIIEKYKDKELVHLDLVDINPDSIRILRRLIKKINIPANFELRVINDDFLKHKFKNSYDLVVGNPPFGGITAEKLRAYQSHGLKSVIESRNLFALFIEKAMNIADVVALFSPKSLLSAPEFNVLRGELGKHAVLKINDYGEKGFKGVKIETISIQVSKKLPKATTRVESLILQSYEVKEQDYITNSGHPYWLIYRDSFFDSISRQLSLGLFEAFRDRSLTTKNMRLTGAIRVIKSRNIRNGGIEKLPTDQFVDSADETPIAKKYFNKQNVIVAPNLSYYPRATFLPENTIVDGSAAVLIPKLPRDITEKDLRFFASREFFAFYRIARNYATRSLNIDSNSVYFWGLPLNELEHTEFNESERSKFLFAKPSTLVAGVAAAS